MAQPESFKIFCILESKKSDMQCISVVNLAKTDTVADLKVAIQGQIGVLAEFNANSLVLFQTSIPVDGNFKESAKAAPQTELGIPTDELAAVFPTGPQKATVQIIVRPPPELTATTPPNPTYPTPFDVTPVRGGRPIYTDPETVDKTIADFVRDLRPGIAEFLENPQPIPAWMPDADDKIKEFYGGLEIPNVNNRPSLLLHDLGKYPNPNVAGLFGGSTHSIFCETSGAGKTRVIFEGLCQYWGFYFVTAQGTDRIGSRDLEFMTLAMPQSPRWKHDVFQDPSIDKVASAARANEEIASRRISQVILARWIIFDTFIKVARELNGGSLPQNIKRQWLFFQILPLVPVGEVDPFLALSRQLIGVGSDVLGKLQKPFSLGNVLASAFNPRMDSFYYVLDEAQLAGRQYMGSFTDGNLKVKRPVLRPIIQYLATLPSINIRIIVSGTGFSLELFKTVLVSGVGKVDLWQVFHSTGDFQDQNVQRMYLSRYLPPSFLASQSGVALTTRLYDWLRGRYRFTAGYLEELMIRAWKEGHPMSPHKLLNEYIHCFIDHYPIDGSKAFLDDEPTVVGSLKVQGFPWEQLRQEKDLTRELSCSLYDYVTRGQYPLWFKDRSELVEYGIARFIDEGKRIIVQEPLALVGIARHFSAEGLTAEGEVKHTLQKNKGRGFEQVLVLALTRIFRHGARLDDIFEFHEDKPEWANCTAQIVARDERRVEIFDLITAEPVLPSMGITHHAEGPVEVERWLRDGGAGWCHPGDYMGPDLVAWLKLSNGELLLLVIQAKCFLTGGKYLSARETADAIRSLSPKNYFSRLTASDNRLKVNTMLDAINGSRSRFTSGRYNILRVIAAYPLDANLQSGSGDVEDALQEDDHPLATLQHLPLVASLAKSSVLGSLSTVLKGAKPGHDSEAESEPVNPRRNPTRKSKA